MRARGAKLYVSKGVDATAPVMAKPEPILEFAPAPAPEKLGGGIGTLIKTRLAVVLATTVLIAVSCFVTWRISTKTSVDAVDSISLAFRTSATSHEIDAVQCFLSTLETAANVLSTHSTALLRNATEVTEDMLAVGTGGLRRITWTTFRSHPRMTMALFMGRRHRRLVAFEKSPSEQTAALLGSPVYELRYVNETTPLATMVGVNTEDSTPLTGGATLFLCQLNTSHFDEPTLPICLGEGHDPGHVYLPIHPWTARDLLVRLDGAPVGNFSYELIIGDTNEPVLAVLTAIMGAAAEPIGTILTMSSATSIHDVLQRLDLVARLKGRAYVAVLEPSVRLHLVSASHGPIIVYVGEGANNRSALLSAFETPELVIRASALYLNSTQDLSQPDINIDEETSLPSLGHFYLSARSLTFRNMHLAVVLLVPYDEIRGEVDQAQDLSFVVVVVVAAAFCLAGALLSILFTVHVGRQVKAKVVLEGTLEEAMTANARLESRLRTLEHSKRATRAHGEVNMETAAEQGVRLLEGVFAGRVKPTAEVLAEIKSLLTAQDRNMPLFLRVPPDQRKHPRPASAGHIDKETSAWLTMTVGSTGGVTHNHPAPKAERSYRRLSWNTTCEVTTGRDDLEVEKALREVHMVTRIIPKNPGPNSLLKRVIPLRIAPDSSKIGGGGGSAVGAGAPRPSRNTIRRWSSGCDDDTNELLPMNLYLASGSFYGGNSHGNGDQNGNLGQLGGVCERDGWTSPALDVRAVQVGKLQEMILRVGDFNLDVRQLDVISKHRPVLFVGYSVMLASGLLETFQLPERPLIAFLSALDKGMPDNPYHSRMHLADVTNNLYHIVSCSGVKQYLQNVDILACVTAALMHDFKHPGRNNDFLVKTRHELAIRYNDRHALESYHLAEAFTLLLDSDLNFLKGLDAATFVTMRNLAIEMVLSTDLKCHFDILNEFKARLKQATPWDREDLRDRRLLLQMMLKLADIGHAAKPLSQHIAWSRAMSEEFWLQGDDEKLMGLSVSPFMDRTNHNEAKSQSGFFSFIVQPLFEAWAAGFPDCRHLADQVALNLEHWVSIMEDESPGTP